LCRDRGRRPLPVAGRLQGRRSGNITTVSCGSFHSVITWIMHTINARALALAVVVVLSFGLTSVGQDVSVSREIPLSVIVVSSEPEAQELVERLMNGEDFAALARKVSTDPTANQGGYMGKLNPAK